MAKNKAASSYGQGDVNNWKRGHLHLLDGYKNGDPAIGAAIQNFAEHRDTNRRSKMWARTIQWAENILFSSGRQYIDDILVSRLSSSTNGDLSTINEATRNIPRPVNDHIGRYVESNISLLTENRPRPRVSPRSGKAEDEDAAKLSEYTLEYLWEALRMPEKHRELARLILHCGVAWMEICYDPLVPRRMTVPQTEKVKGVEMVGPDGTPITLPIERNVQSRDEFGNIVFEADVQYGDVTANIISPFEMHVPNCHYWNGENMEWVMRESFMPISVLQDKFSNARTMGLKKSDGWYVDRIEDVQPYNITNMPLWWWERLSDVVEGPGPSLYIGTPDEWQDYTSYRIFDRKPCKQWPKGRTIIVAGNQVIYDSPKDRGARAYSVRWPERWHPYVRFAWEQQPGSVYARSLVSKLLPKLKRVNAIDTTMIMWRRTVPISAWIAPRGTLAVEDSWVGGTGQVWEYDPRRTNNQKPEPIYPPDYPAAAIEERKQMLVEMEMIAGTEEILRGQKPQGVSSATALEVLRKQALASRSSILQAWDESLQEEGTSLLQEVIKHIRNDERYLQRIKVLARERHSEIAIANFSGTDLSDNVVVNVDTASLALISKEAKEAKALEFLQYSQGLMGLPIGLRQAILDEMGFKDTLNPQGPDVDRAKRMMAYIRQEEYQLVTPMFEDDPAVFYDFLIRELKSDSFIDLNPNQQKMILQLIDQYKNMLQFREKQMMQMQMAMMEAQKGPKENE